MTRRTNSRETLYDRFKTYNNRPRATRFYLFIYAFLFFHFSIRGDRPMPPNRYRLQMRGNIVQLTLKQSQKDDTGQYALVATRIGQPFEKGSTRRIHLRVDEPSYEEGEPPIFLRRLTDLAVKVGTRTRFLVEIRSSTNPKVGRLRLTFSRVNSLTVQTSKFLNSV